MKKWIVVYLVLTLCCMNGCGNSSEVETQENISVYPATIDTFYSLESFLEYASTAKSGDGLADLASLEYFYLPTGLPEGYQLIKINVGGVDIGFTYLPADAAAQEGADRWAESSHDHIQLISSRGYYVFESIMDQFDVTEEDLAHGKYIVDEYGERMTVTWEEDGTVLMLSIPRQFKFEDWTALCSVQKYVRMEDNTFIKLEEQQ